MPDHPHGRAVKQQNQRDADESPIERHGDTENRHLATVSSCLIPMPADEGGLGKKNHQRIGVIPKEVAVGARGERDDQSGTGSEPDNGQQDGDGPEDDLQAEEEREVEMVAGYGERGQQKRQCGGAEPAHGNIAAGPPIRRSSTARS